MDHDINILGTFRRRSSIRILARFILDAVFPETRNRHAAVRNCRENV